MYFLQTLTPKKTRHLRALAQGPGQSDGLQKGLQDLLFGVVHALPGAQLGHGVVESHLRF